MTEERIPATGRSFPPGGGVLAVLALVVIIIVASVVAVVPKFGPETVASSGSSGSSGQSGDNGSGAAGSSLGPGQAGSNGSSGKGGSSGKSGTSGKGGSGTGASPTPGTYTCTASGNGGNTDKGVTATSINLASTIVNSGVGASFLGDTQYAMQAVVNQVNGAGGICGRQIKLTLNDDGWNPSTGCGYIQNYINGGMFALPVEPSSEGLTQCIENNSIHNAGIPVIGTDGMLKQQYAASGSADWVWPIATSTVSTMHIMALDAYQHGARTFCLAYDNQYKFGLEGHVAFHNEVTQRLSGATDVYDQPLDPTKASQPGGYSAEINTFDTNCANVDFVGMLLQPGPAAAWIKGSGGTPGAYMGNPNKGYAAGAQPMFTDDLGVNCGNPCNNLKVYSGFRPPLDPYNSLASVQQYVNALNKQKSNLYADNQFTESAYDGMLLTVQALTAVGPNLTRAAVRQYLDSTAFDTTGNGLTPPVAWHPGNHFANTSMLAYTMVCGSGSCTGYRRASDFIPDPNPTADTQ